MFKKIKILVLLCFFLPQITKAATLYLEPLIAEYGIGETFIQEVRIDLDPGENINLVEVKLKYSSDSLEVIDVSFGNSIFTIIPHQPIIDQEEGIVSFAGGIIGGYTGRIPGDPGESNLLAKIIFKTKKSLNNFGEIKFLEDSQALLNDGFGTPTKLAFKSATINISEEKVSLKDKWQEEIEKDKIPPEPFTIEIRKDPSVFDGKYFLVFSTTDKQTGIDHYEISETKNKNEENWQRGESPYLLTDQSLKSYIKIKAVDKAGNERIIELPPQNLFLKYKIISILLILFLVFLCLFIIWQKIKKIISFKIKSKENQ